VRDRSREQVSVSGGLRSALSPSPPTLTRLLHLPEHPNEAGAKAGCNQQKQNGVIGVRERGHRCCTATNARAKTAAAAVRCDGQRFGGRKPPKRSAWAEFYRHVLGQWAALGIQFPPRPASDSLRCKDAPAAFLESTGEPVRGCAAFRAG
jgi:hypothetical protein